MRDASHMEAVERWAEFVRNNPRKEWKKAVNVLIDATYDKADKFYEKLGETEKGREILRRLEEERINGLAKVGSSQGN